MKKQQMIYDGFRCDYPAKPANYSAAAKRAVSALADRKSVV